MTNSSATAQSLPTIPSCALDGEGRRRQQARLARLGPQVERAVHTGSSLEVVFAPGFDRAALEEVLAVERECCPFLGIDVGERRLTIAVERDDDAPMLDVFAEALGGAAAR